MARYVPHLVRWWPRLIDTLLAMRTGTYPQGWLDGGTRMSDHNNYDVVELFYRGWVRMVPRQRDAASQAVKELLDWCLVSSVKEDGNLTCPDKSDPIPDSFYYAASFWGGLISPLLILYATTHQITLAGPILVTTVVGLVVFLVAVLVSPETKGKVLAAELTIA
jgi:hypothetical protein